ncbi:GTP-dependent dephospho-CoA kinase family protein [Sulfurisphaera javensis]|uniref:GTP-dependent dephospho-CoA kinase n=1 Tax=Sulfurisphaera javensis TaxID=2049879 RepID=A0AAT9GR92_9CREN
MPEDLKKELSRPYGFLFTDKNSLINFLLLNKGQRIITVGDVVTETLRTNGIIPFLSIIDGKTKRNIKIDLKEDHLIKIRNEKSTIRLSSIKTIKDILNENYSKKSIILVDGEEDLLVIPVVLFGRDKDIIIYGQPNAGAVVIINNQLTRIRVKQILEKFYVKNC